MPPSFPNGFQGPDQGEQVYINEARTSRDFCYITDNVVEANLLASLRGPGCPKPDLQCGLWQPHNAHERWAHPREVARRHPEAAKAKAEYRDFRKGDAVLSLADISRPGNCSAIRPNSMCGRPTPCGRMQADANLQ